MQGWMWALIFMVPLLFLYRAFVRFIAVLLSKVLPHSVIFDKGFADRHPKVVLGLVGLTYLVILSGFAVLAH
jgi:hypothetical protein